MDPLEPQPRPDRHTHSAQHQLPSTATPPRRSRGLAIAIPALTAWLLLRRDRPFTASCILCLWALPAGVFGLWTWVFSLFAR